MKLLGIALALGLSLVSLGAAARPMHNHSAALFAPDCPVLASCGTVVAVVGKERTQRASYRAAGPVYAAGNSVVGHPAGCPRRAFCGCGASVRVFGRAVRSLYLAANWLRFPRAAPAPGMAAARRGHVFVLESYVGGSTWIVYDANSGGHATRIHARSIAGYSIVNPRAS